MPKGWNAKYEDPEDMRRDLLAYFAECDHRTTLKMNRLGLPVQEADPEAYTVAGMALACNMNKTTMRNYMVLDGFKEILDWAYAKMERQWSALNARPGNNGGVMYYMGNVFKGEYVSQANINVGGQPGNPLTTVTRTDKDRLAECTMKELEQIEKILMEAEKRGE